MSKYLTEKISQTWQERQLRKSARSIDPNNPFDKIKLELERKRTVKYESNLEELQKHIEQFQQKFKNFSEYKKIIQSNLQYQRSGNQQDADNSFDLNSLMEFSDFQDASVERDVISSTEQSPIRLQQQLQKHLKVGDSGQQPKKEVLLTL